MLSFRSYQLVVAGFAGSRLEKRRSEDSMSARHGTLSGTCSKEVEMWRGPVVEAFRGRRAEPVVVVSTGDSGCRPQSYSVLRAAYNEEKLTMRFG
jgi:hypothetical protein